MLGTSCLQLRWETPNNKGPSEGVLMVKGFSSTRHIPAAPRESCWWHLVFNAASKGGLSCRPLPQLQSPSERGCHWVQTTAVVSSCENPGTDHFAEEDGGRKKDKLVGG